MGAQKLWGCVVEGCVWTQLLLCWEQVRVQCVGAQLLWGCVVKGCMWAQLLCCEGVRVGTTAVGLGHAGGLALRVGH